MFYVSVIVGVIVSVKHFFYKESITLIFCFLETEKSNNSSVEKLVIDTKNSHYSPIMKMGVTWESYRNYIGGRWEVCFLYGKIEQ